MPSKLVGVVDDDEDVRTSIESLLRSAGYRPFCFRSAESFLASSHRDIVDCLLTDFNMPGLNGLELHRKIARDRPSLPVILMTAFPTDIVRQGAEEQGIAGFFVKPIDGDLLIDKLEDVLC
ncbi:response regulator [Sphingopyxis sp. YF1]|nr:response regulator [Sphingopyxis sp. YF1]